MVIPRVSFCTLHTPINSILTKNSLNQTREKKTKEQNGQNTFARVAELGRPADEHKDTDINDYKVILYLAKLMSNLNKSHKSRPTSADESPAGASEQKKIIWEFALRVVQLDTSGHK